MQKKKGDGVRYVSWLMGDGEQGRSRQGRTGVEESFEGIGQDGVCVWGGGG